VAPAPCPDKSDLSRKAGIYISYRCWL
jgi:hypothetical protein